MGGVSALRYLGTYGQDTSLPQVQTLTAIGAPFNDFVDDSAQSLTDELAKGACCCFLTAIKITSK